MSIEKDFLEWAEAYGHYRVIEAHKRYTSYVQELQEKEQRRKELTAAILRAKGR